MHLRTVPLLAAGLLLALAAAVGLAPAAALPMADDDPDLAQTLGDLKVVEGRRVLTSGHLDMGPKIVAGRWTFLVHDDAARSGQGATSVWRYPDQTVIKVLDAGRLTMPDNPAYSFIGAEPGSALWVVPQTQNPEVVWLGWNTQDPQVMTSVDRGVTLSLAGVQGPGVMTVYLQSGSLDEPEVLWDSRVDELQSIWVDVNTHTHANWVFTRPGVYLVALRAEAELRDGSTVSDTQIVRFAVGSATTPAAAFDAVWSGPVQAPTAGSTQGAAAGAGGGSDDAGVLVPVLVGAIVVVALALVVGAVLVGVRGRRARRQVMTKRSSPDDVAEARQ